MRGFLPMRNSYVAFQCAAQFANGAEYAVPRRAGTNAERAGYFINRQAFVMTQHESAALNLAESREGGFEGRGGLRATGGAFGRRSWRRQAAEGIVPGIG